MKKMKLAQSNVLIVDDEFLSREVISSYLFELTAEIKIASNGKEALEVLKNEKIDLIVTDINMPEMNGIDLIKAIRASQESYKDIIIIAITANENENILQSVRDAGASDLLSKPISQTQLINAIEKALMNQA